jgi:Flp pilus assembly protein CpaB
MELEFHDTRRRGRVIIAIGVILALAAGGGAFYVVNQAHEQAGQAGLQKTTAVVAVRAIPARAAIAAADVEVRQVPLDPTNANGVVSDPIEVIGRIPAVTILQGQLVTRNMLASTTTGGAFAILGPGETLSPDSPAWRAVSITVPDDLAVGGSLKGGETVDVFVTAIVNVPQDVVAKGRYATERSTKVIYQNVQILARTGAFYILRAPLAMAEELAHLQAIGTATMSFALRPDVDQRTVDSTNLGETTNRIIRKYGLPVPENYPLGSEPVRPTPTPLPTATPSATRGPAGSPGPSSSKLPVSVTP